MNIHPPRLPGPYEFQHCLGKDELNEVWKASDTRRHLSVAINILHFPAQAPQDVVTRFQHETSALTTLHHPSISPINAVGLLPPGQGMGDAYIVTDFVDGPSLDRYLQSLFSTNQFPSPTAILRVLAPICDAIDYAHQHGVIHGLLKPASIILERRRASDTVPGDARLVGFGRHNTLNVGSFPLQDLAYIAPEVLQGNTNNIRSDLYSLGVILYEMCTGRVPFQAQSAVALISLVAHSAPPPPTSFQPTIPPEMTAVLLRALAHNPMERFPSAWAMIAAVARAFNVSLQGMVRSDGFDPLNNPTVLTPMLPIEQAASGQHPSLNPPSNAPSSTPVIPEHQAALSALPTINISSQRETPSKPVDQRPTTRLGYDASSPFAVRRRGPSRPVLILLTLLLLVTVGASIASWLLFFRPASGTAPIGHAFFISSGLVDSTSNHGITDRIQLTLNNINAPQAGKQYYAWLLSTADDPDETLPLLLGVLPVTNHQATLSYQGDPQNTNLLSKYSRLLITEESASVQPANPSLQATDWRYGASISHTPNPEDTTNHYSLLDHIRHLLAQDPKLKNVNIVGGLDTWCFRNTLKIMEWSGSARDAITAGNVQLARRHLVRILDYLLGSQYVVTAGIPSDLDPILADPTISRVALLTTSEEQNPPGYLRHIGSHLREITQSPGATPQQKQTAARINNAINHIQDHLEQVRDEALQLVKMPVDQLRKPATLNNFNTLFTQAHNAFAGTLDPNTNQLEEGVAQIHYDVQSLATLALTPCINKNEQNSCA